MKKVALSLLAFGLVGAMAFADDAAAKTSIGAWGRGIFVPVATGGLDNPGGDKNYQTLLGTSWGNAYRIGITVSGTSQNVGFQTDINSDNGSISLGDQQKIWIKPMDGLTIQLGQAYDDTLRGNGTFGAWDWLREDNMLGEDLTFKRLDTQKGVEVAYATGPIYVFAAVTGLSGSNASLGHVGKTMQEGVGFTIDGVGLVRAQLIGTSTAGITDYQRIQAAFKLTSIQNLYLDVGAEFPTNSDMNKVFNAYANYTIDKAKLHVVGQYTVPKTGDAPMTFGAGADYGLDGGLTLSGDVRYYNKTASSTGDANTTFGGYVSKGFSNGLLGVGVEYAARAASANAVANQDNTAAQFTIPVRMEYWF